MRIHMHALCRTGNTDTVKHVDRAFKRITLGHAAMFHQYLGHLSGYFEERVKRRHRILKDHRHRHTADFVKLA